jgi:putative DNA primase/helicase
MLSASRPSARDLRDRLVPYAESIIAEIAPNARKRGRRIHLGSINGEPGWSLHINPRTGEWIDRADNEARGDILSLIKGLACGGDSKKAYRWALDWLGEDKPPIKVKRAEPKPPQYETLSPNACLIWANAKPITPDDPAGQYLLVRGCELPHPDGDLRWLPSHPYPYSCGRGHTGPALIGLITDVRNASRSISLHQTWIATDGSGRKAFDCLSHIPDELRPDSRLTLAHHTTKGGCIRLWPDDAVTLGLGVGEGVETSLTLAREITPVWSMINASAIAELPYLRPIKSITVAIDRDQAGEKAFEALAERWSVAGAEVWGIRAEKATADLNDLVRDRRYA